MRPIKLTMSAFGPYSGELLVRELKVPGLYLVCGDTVPKQDHDAFDAVSLPVRISQRPRSHRT